LSLIRVEFVAFFRVVVVVSVFSLSLSVCCVGFFCFVSLLHFVLYYDSFGYTQLLLLLNCKVFFLHYLFCIVFQHFLFCVKKAQFSPLEVFQLIECLRKLSRRSQTEVGSTTLEIVGIRSGLRGKRNYCLQFLISKMCFKRKTTFDNITNKFNPYCRSWRFGYLHFLYWKYIRTVFVCTDFSKSSSRVIWISLWCR
jgi:hypothetical protein